MTGGDDAGTRAGGSIGTGVLQATSRAIDALTTMIRVSRNLDAMGLLILEALGALLLLVFIVWWTMFSGRRRGERAADTQPPNDVPNDPSD